MIKKICKNLLLLLYLPIWYLLGLKKRDNNLWVFSSWSGEKYNDNSRIFYEYIASHYPEIKCVWILQNAELIENLNKQNILAINSRSTKAKSLIKKAGKIFTTRDDELNFLLINGAEWYQLWHGMPLKKIKLDANEGLMQFKKISQFRRGIGKILHPWTPFNYKKRYTVTSSNFFIPYLITSFRLPEERILKTGLPRCDALFDNKEENLIKKIRSTYPGCTLILYMPTTRNSQWGDSLFNPFVEVYSFSESEFLDVLERNNLVFVYKPHFYDSCILEEKKLETRFIKIKEDDIYELYNFVGQVDVLMTDYSSIYFDFIQTKKSVILTPFDYEDYISKSRQHYFDYYENMEGVKAYNWKDVYEILDKKIYKSVSSQTLERFAEFVDSHSCEKLAKKILGEN